MNRKLELLAASKADKVSDRQRLRLQPNGLFHGGQNVGSLGGQVESVIEELAEEGEHVVEWRRESHVGSHVLDAEKFAVKVFYVVTIEAILDWIKGCAASCDCCWVLHRLIVD